MVLAPSHSCDVHLCPLFGSLRCRRRVLVSSQHAHATKSWEESQEDLLLFVPRSTTLPAALPASPWQFATKEKQRDVRKKEPRHAFGERWHGKHCLRHCRCHDIGTQQGGDSGVVAQPGHRRRCPTQTLKERAERSTVERIAHTLRGRPTSFHCVFCSVDCT